MRASDSDFIEIARASSESDAVMLAIMLKGIGIPVAGSGLSIQVRPSDYARAAERLRAARVPILETRLDVAASPDRSRVEAWQAELLREGIESSIATTRGKDGQTYTLIVGVADFQAARAVLQRSGLTMRSELGGPVEPSRRGLAARLDPESAARERGREAWRTVSAVLLIIGGLLLLGILIGLSASLCGGTQQVNSLP